MGGMHQISSGSKAKAAAIYSSALCKAILQGIRNQMRVDRRLQERILGFMGPVTVLTRFMEDDSDAFETNGQASGAFGQETNAVYKQPGIRDALTGQ